MDLAELERELIAIARANPPSDRVPYAFGKRIMSLLLAKPVVDQWALWSRALWRSAAACLAVMLLLSALSFFLPASPTTPRSDLSQDFERTMLVAVDQDSGSSW